MEGILLSNQENVFLPNRKTVDKSEEIARLEALLASIEKEESQLTEKLHIKHQERDRLLAELLPPITTSTLQEEIQNLPSLEEQAELER